MTDKALSNLTQGSSDTGEFIYGVVDSSSRKIQIGTLPFQTETDADVVGPASAIDNAIARYNGVTGKLIQNSGVTIDDSDNVSGMATITLPNTGLHILDTSGDHDYIIAPGEDASADRTLTLDLNNADRTLDITGNTTLAGGTHSGTNTGDEDAASIRSLGFFDTSNDGTGSGLDADLLDGNHASAFETADADILKADTPDTLTAGFAHTPDNDGTQSSGTYTPDQDGGNMKRIVNGGAFTLAPPTDDCCIIVQITNNGSAGTVTTSGFTGVFGDSFTTTDGDDFICTIIKINGFSSLTVQDVS